MRKMHTMRLNESLIEKVRDIATKENRTATNLIETVLLKFVEDYEKNHIIGSMGQNSEGRSSVPE